MCAARLWKSTLVASLLALGLLRTCYGGLPTLTTALTVHSLSSAEAARNYPVHVRGVVTNYEPEWLSLYVSDATGGIFVDTLLRPVPLHAGQLVEVEGFSGQGGFAPTIRMSGYRVIGEAEIPPARQVSLESLSTGTQAAQYVEVRGIVRSATVADRRLTLTLAMGNESIEISTPRFSGSSFEYLVDAQVRVRGVAGQRFNDKRQMIGSKLMMTSLSDLRIVEPAPTDVFALPLRAASGLLPYSSAGVLGHRVRIRGVVTLQWPGEQLVIQDSSQSVLVRSGQATLLKLGDTADVVGFPGTIGYSPTLEQALFRHAGKNNEVAPRQISAKEAIAGKFDIELVRIQGTLLHLNKTSKGYTLVLSSGGLVFDAVLPSSQGGAALSAVPVGAEIQVTGICLVEADANHKPQDFGILLRSPRDVTVVETPSWWTARRSLYALSIASAAGVLVLVWIAVLRRRVAQQTRFIRTQLETAEKLKVVAADSEARFQAFMDHSPLIGFIKDEQGRMIYLNRRFVDVFGRTLEDCLGKDDFELWPEQTAHALRRNDLEVLGCGKSVEFIETTPVQGSEAITWLSLKFPFKQGLRTYLGGMAIDITERERAKETLRISEERFQSLFSHATVGIAIADQGGAMMRVNSAFCRILQMSEKECLGTSAPFLLDCDARVLPDLSNYSAATGTTFESSHQRNGATVWTENCLFAVPDTAGGVLNLVIIVEDITRRKMAEVQLKFQARHDALTGLTNRRAHETCLSEQIQEAASNQRKLCLLYVDLDDFKIVNDTMGHDAGDLVLREAARRLSSLVTDHNLLSRIGGDEFVLIQYVENRNDALVLASRLRLAMEQPFQLNGTYVELRASVGFSVFPEDGLDARSLAKSADDAMYAAKRLEKVNRYPRGRQPVELLDKSPVLR